MSQPVLVKVYGGFRPVTPEFHAALTSALEGAIPADHIHIGLDGAMCVMSFEGVYFPLEDVLTAICRHAPRDATGRLDYIDLENWRLWRHEFAKGELSCHDADLNHVLDYSGF